MFQSFIEVTARSISNFVWLVPIIWLFWPNEFNPCLQKKRIDSISRDGSLKGKSASVVLYSKDEHDDEDEYGDEEEDAKSDNSYVNMN